MVRVGLARKKNRSSNWSTRFCFGSKISGSGREFFGSGQKILTYFAMSRYRWWDKRQKYRFCDSGISWIGMRWMCTIGVGLRRNWLVGSWAGRYYWWENHHILRFLNLSLKAWSWCVRWAWWLTQIINTDRGLGLPKYGSWRGLLIDLGLAVLSGL